jgi:hypothetical protein
VPEKQSDEPSAFHAAVEDGVVKLSFRDACRLVFPTLTSMTAVHLGLVALAFASLIRDAQATDRAARLPRTGAPKRLECFAESGKVKSYFNRA